MAMARARLRAGLAFLTLAVTAAVAPAVPAAAAQATDFAKWVNPFVGTRPGGADHGTGGGAGNTFPGAVAPFGMVQWSPDTVKSQPGGYFYDDNALTGFSLTHLSGAGCSTYQDIPFIPYVGEVSTSPATDPAHYTSKFSHANEHATAGAYDVTLDSGAKVELAATQRTGSARLTYPAGASSTLLVEHLRLGQRHRRRVDHHRQGHHQRLGHERPLLRGAEQLPRLLLGQVRHAVRVDRHLEERRRHAGQVRRNRWCQGEGRAAQRCRRLDRASGQGQAAGHHRQRPGQRRVRHLRQPQRRAGERPGRTVLCVRRRREGQPQGREHQEVVRHRGRGCAEGVERPARQDRRLRWLGRRHDDVLHLAVPLADPAERLLRCGRSVPRLRRADPQGRQGPRDVHELLRLGHLPLGGPPPGDDRPEGDLGHRPVDDGLRRAGRVVGPLDGGQRLHRRDERRSVPHHRVQRVRVRRA